MEPAGAVTSRDIPAYLPTDIITQLIYALADIYPSRAPWRVRRSRGDLRAGTPGSLGWIVMTHVSQRWRSIGLDLSVLWAEIVCIFPSAVKDIAQRTKTTSLTLDLSWTREPDDHLDAMDRLDLISRARTLKVAEFPGLALDSGNDSSRFLLNRTFSHLRSLSIILDNFTDHMAKRLNPVTATGLRSLTTNVPLAIVAPSLTSLRAQGAIWRYKLLLEYIRQYPVLADLHIDAIYGDPQFDEVDKSPRSLETSIQMGNRIAQASTVCLSHLRSLSFTVAGLQAIRFLQYLETPNCTKFEIAETWDETALGDLLAQSNQHRGPCNTLTIYDMRNDECGVNIVFTEREPYLNRQPKFTRGSMLCYNMTEDLNEIPDVLSAIPLPSSIHTLALDHNCRCRDWECGGILRGIGLVDPFLSSFKRFRNVTSLYLRHQEGMIDAAGLVALAGISPDEWIFPVLRELVVDLSVLAAKEWWNDIREALSARQVAGRQIDRLMVRGTGACHAWPRNVSEQQAARLQIMEGAMDNDQITAWLRNYEITLDPERQVVTEVTDERLSDCVCLADILDGSPPWEFLT